MFLSPKSTKVKIGNHYIQNHPINFKKVSGFYRIDSQLAGVKCFKIICHGDMKYEWVFASKTERNDVYESLISAVEVRVLLRPEDKTPRIFSNKKFAMSDYD
jgi:hypothetical protein